MDRSVLQELLKCKEERRGVAVITELSSGAQRLVHFENIAGEGAFAEPLAQAFAGDQSRTVEIEGAEHFIHVHNPPLKMIVVGAVHVAQALIPIAEAAGYALTVIDPRGAFATEQRFPGVTLVEDWPDDVMPGLDIDRRSAVLALTHDPKIDDPALTFALRSDCFYIGALGSKKTHAGRLERLGAHGFNAEVLQRIHGPIGLDIGARGVVEIAIAIMAEVTGALRKGGA